MEKQRRPEMRDAECIAEKFVLFYENSNLLKVLKNCTVVVTFAIFSNSTVVQRMISRERD